MSRRKRNRIVLFTAINPSAADTNATVNRRPSQVRSELLEEDAYVQKFLGLADTALSAWSKPERSKLA